MNGYYLKIFIISLNILGAALYAMENHHHQNCVIQRKAAQCMMSKILLYDNENILSVGCDYGKIKQKYPFVKKIDYIDDFDQLQKKKKKVSQYDTVLLFFSSNLIKGYWQTFLEKASALKREGRFFGIIPYYKSPHLELYYQIFAHSKWKDYYNEKMKIPLYTSRSIKHSLESEGFAQVQCHIINKAFRFKTKEKFRRWIMSNSEQFIDVSQEDYSLFINDIINTYMEIYDTAKDQPIEFRFPYILIKGYKR